MEKTLVILKPDTVQRRLIGEIITRFERKGFTISRLQMMKISVETAEEHYAHVRTRPFFKSMIEYITSGEVVAMVIEGEHAIQVVRNMIGKTSPFDAVPGTIRGDFGLHAFQNLIHASDSVDNAEVEIKRFFRQG